MGNRTLESPIKRFVFHVYRFISKKDENQNESKIVESIDSTRDKEQYSNGRKCLTSFEICRFC